MAPSGGIMGRFENARQRSTAKRIVSCEAGTPEYMRNDYLKPNHLPIHEVDRSLNFNPTANMNETRFHQGFQRRNQRDIQQDCARLEAEVMREMRREESDRQQIQLARQMKERVTFNILTGEGLGRENEFRQLGKKILNPHGSMPGVFAEHSVDASNRIKNSKHRFFEHPTPQNSDHRVETVFNEGLTQSKRETCILGYGDAPRRAKLMSTGVSDNYQHLRGLPREPEWETKYGNASQIVLG